MKFLLFFTLISFSNYVFTQIIVRKIVDKQTGEPIAFATVKILHASKGTIANEGGEFNLQINPIDSVLISSVGYEKIILTGSQMEPIIYLNQKIKTLGNITVGKKKFLRSELLGNQDKNIIADINWGPSNQGKDEIAQKIELPDSALFYKIQKIHIPIKKFVCLSPILLHIYAADSVSGKPGEELLLKFVDINKKNVHNREVNIDVGTANLYFYNSTAFFISVSWPDEAYYNKCITTILLSKYSDAKTFVRSLNSATYNWFSFGNMKDIKGNSYEVRSFYSVEVDEMK